MMDEDDWIPLRGVRRGAVSADRDTIGLELEDVAGRAHRFSLDFRSYSSFFIGLLSVVEMARRAREAEGVAALTASGTDTVVLPLPVVAYHLGRADDGERVVVRLTTDNKLDWDFLFPSSAAEDLARNLNVLLSGPKEAL